MLDSYPTLTVNWNYPTIVRFGPGRIKDLPQAVRDAGMARPLLVTDPGLKGLPMITTALDSLKGHGINAALFADIQGNPVARNVEEGLARYRAGGHDGVIAFGGGSAMDVGKVIAFMAGQTRPMWDFEDREDWFSRADPNGIAPIVAVPTTSGTGSEVGRAGVITDETDHTKKVIFHPKMLPRIVVADPELTAGLPATVTAAVGMDAFSHLLEAYCATMYHPMATGIALEGMRLVKEWLPVAVAEPGNIAARAYMMTASSMGATAFQRGLGGMHAMSHPCSSLKGTHHGLTNAVVMPYVLIRNRDAIAQKLAAAARYLDLPGQGFEGFLAYVLDLRQRIGIPATLSEIGIPADLISQLAPMAEADPTNGGNPLPLATADYERLFDKAIRGDLTP